jgi:hypothetical protein
MGPRKIQNCRSILSRRIVTMDTDVLPYIIGFTAVVMGGLAVLIPIAGLTARFALKPIIEAITAFKGAQGSDQRVGFLEQRLSLLEEQLHAVERDHERLVEENDFRRKLEAPRVAELPRGD